MTRKSKVLAAIAGSATAAFLAVSLIMPGAAYASTHKPHNYNGASSIMYAAANTGLDLRISASNVLDVNSSYSTTFEYVEEEGTPGFGELYDTVNGLCMGWSNAAQEFYDNTCQATSAWDDWVWGSDSTYSTLNNTWLTEHNNANECLWEDGVSGDQTYAATCSGTDGHDRWHMMSEPATDSVSAVAMPQSCNNSGQWANEFGGWDTASNTVGAQVYADADSEGFTWCQVNDSGDDANGYRVSGTNLCAQYKGSNDGPGSVRLETCDVTGTPGQQWVQLGDQDHPSEVTLTSDVQQDASLIGVCLSSDSGTYEPLVMVDEGVGGCNGNGGQSWQYSAP